MKLQDRLKEIRQQRGMTLLQVATVTKLSTSYLSDLEHSRTNPSLDTLARLATSYGMTMADIVSGVDNWGTLSLEGLAPGLAELVKKGQIDEATAHDLNRIELGGKRPQMEDEWFELYLYLKRLLKPYFAKQDEPAKSE